MPKISTEKLQLRRKEILDKAFEVFSLKGYCQATMDDIVKHSGISKGGLYIYFKSKNLRGNRVLGQLFSIEPSFR